MPRLEWLIGCWLLLRLLPVQAQTPTCDGLPADKQKIAAGILAREHPYDCCDRTIQECLAQKPVCALAVRLAENICRRVENGEERERISRSLSRRAQSMLPSARKAVIAHEEVPALGDEKARVTLVMYACARCPLCGKITPLLHQAVTLGRLRGKVRLLFKTFPVKSHPFAKEAGLAFTAAAGMGRFWEFALHAFAHFDEFKPDALPAWAASVGLDQAEFQARLRDPATRKRLVANKKEGIRNKVDATPAFFINGRAFAGDLTAEEIIDVAEEEYERITVLKPEEALP